MVFQDYFAMELQEGHLFVHLELGSGPVKVKASRYELNDGSWHKVALTLRKQNGRVSIDGDAEVFQTPGKYQTDSINSILLFFSINVIIAK